MTHILIYNDQGVSPESYQETLALFQRVGTEKNWQISTVSAENLNHEAWEETATLLVIPGGRATPYNKALHPIGNQKIKDFVASGGSYLGICAGGYYGASQIIFEKGNSDYEIITTSALGLYTGIAEGPAYELGVFRYQSEAGARTASLISTISDNNAFPTYFNGGCWFHSHQDNKDNNQTTIIARYADIETQPAAIILTRYGKGRVCLTGVHVEYVLNDGYQPQRDHFIQRLFQFLL
jgi:glutamine amidotransferase-like uncharacterized protein